MQNVIFAVIGAVCAVAGAVVALAVYNANQKKIVPATVKKPVV